jgi:tRNA(fMet)-specific endonuclease VapC
LYAEDHLNNLIAAHAVAMGVTAVTNNLMDFFKYQNVYTEIWLHVPNGIT